MNTINNLKENLISDDDHRLNYLRKDQVNV